MTQSDQAKAAAENAQPRIDPVTVIGWSVDADPDNDPTWPMRNRAGDDGTGLNWARPRLQQTDVEILQSVEHPRAPAVLGLSAPPSGASGVVRRLAFRFSESQWGHWLLLMLADRINAAEGLVEDVFRHHALERTPASGTRHTRPSALTLAFTGIAIAGLVYLMRRRR